MISILLARCNAFLRSLADGNGVFAKTVVTVVEFSNCLAIRKERNQLHKKKEESMRNAASSLGGEQCLVPPAAKAAPSRGHLRQSHQKQP